MKNKFLLGVISVAVGASCLFAACGGGEKGGEDSEPVHTHTFSQQWTSDENYHWHASTCGHLSELDGKAAHNFVGNSCDICGYINAAAPSITFADFLAKHMDKAQNFVSENIRPAALAKYGIDADDVLAEKWSISANKDDNLDSVSLAFTYKVDETNRTVKIVNITLENPIDLDDIVNSKVKMSDHTINITEKTVFTFDAKETAEKQELADALYAAHNETSDLMLFTEIKASRTTRKAYDILLETENGYKVKTLEVLREDGKDETIIANLEDGKTADFKTKSHLLNGTNIYSSEYALEKFDAPIVTPIDPEKPDPVTKEDLVKALEENCKDELLNRCLAGLDVDKNNVSNENWYVTKDSNGNITSAEYSFNYQRNETGAYYIVGKVNFSNSISAEDLKNGNIENATYTRLYRFGYQSNIQDSRADLTNAICDTLFGENNTATRYIVDNGTGTGSNLNSRQFTVVEVVDNEVSEMKIYIKDATGENKDAKIIANLENGDYSIISNETYKLSGENIS